MDSISSTSSSGIIHKQSNTSKIHTPATKSIVMFCGPHGLWPSWFVAVIAVAIMVNVVAIMVCGRHCRTPKSPNQPPHSTQPGHPSVGKWKSWRVNRYTTWYTSLIAMIWQCKLRATEMGDQHHPMSHVTREALDFLKLGMYCKLCIILLYSLLLLSRDRQRTWQRITVSAASYRLTQYWHAI